jgi:hypothetical protein
MIAINTAGLLFLRQRAARWVLAAWIGNVVFMSILYELNGYNRLLGLSHVIFWTPLVLWLFRRRAALREPRPFGVWVVLLVATNSVSLVIDYVDVLRYLLGDRS